MIKLFVFISLLTISINLQSQRIELLGTWTLSKHYVFDTTLKKDTNIFNGQISREITFHEGGILVLTTDNGEQFFGKWKLSKSRRKFSIDSDLRDFGFVSTKSSKHEFRNNELKIPFERLKPLYWTGHDSFWGGTSIYVKTTTDSNFVSIDTAKAHQYYLKGLEILKNNPDDVGQVAIKSFQAANQLRPLYYWETYFWIARYTYFRDINALKSINVAIQIKPKDSKLYSLRAMINSHWGNYDEALSDLNWALIFDNDNPELLLKRANLLNLEFGLIQEAKNDLNKALEINNTYIPAYLARAEINTILNLKEEACMDYKKAIEFGYTGWNHQMRKCGIKP